MAFGGIGVTLAFLLSAACHRQNRDALQRDPLEPAKRHTPAPDKSEVDEDLNDAISF
jgi:hypothetical protein